MKPALARKLATAIRQGKVEEVRGYLESGAPVDRPLEIPVASSSKIHLPLSLIIAKTPRSGEMAKLLLAHGANPHDVLLHGGASSFKNAIDQGLPEVVDAIIEHGGGMAGVVAQVLGQCYKNPEKYGKAIGGQVWSAFYSATHSKKSKNGAELAVSMAIAMRPYLNDSCPYGSLSLDKKSLEVWRDVLTEKSATKEHFDRLDSLYPLQKLAQQDMDNASQLGWVRTGFWSAVAKASRHAPIKSIALSVPPQNWMKHWRHDSPESIFYTWVYKSSPNRFKLALEHVQSDEQANEMLMKDMDALTSIAASQAYPAVLSMLLDIHPHFTPHRANDLLLKCFDDGHLEHRVRKIILLGSKGASLDRRLGAGDTLLHKACEMEPGQAQQMLIDYFLASGLEWTTENEIGKSARDVLEKKNPALAARYANRELERAVPQVAGVPCSVARL